MLFDEPDLELLDLALDGDPEPAALIACYRMLLARLAPLSPDGWLLQGGDILPHTMQLSDQVDRLPVTVIADARYQDGEPASDAAVLAELGDGQISRPYPNGERVYRPALLVELHELRQKVRALEAAAGVVVGVVDREWRYALIPRQVDG